jgi:hypothetical protein
MRENHGHSVKTLSRGRILLLALAATATMIAASLGFARSADAAADLKLTFDQGQIGVLSDVLGPIEATPPADQPVTVTGQLTGNNFSAQQSGFFFPSQTIELPSEVAGLLGPNVVISIQARNSFTGTFDSASGAFSSTVPLGLTLSFNPGNILACTLPLTASFSTSGTLTFPGAGEGGSDLSFSGSPFAPPSGTGAIYGAFPVVKFEDVQDAPESEAPAGTCATILGLLPAFIPELAGIEGIAGELWLGGRADVTGDPDPQPQPQPTKGRVAVVKPKPVTIRAGRRGVVRVVVRNTGNAAATGVRVCGTIAARIARRPGCVNLGRINAGARKTAALRVAVQRRARGNGRLNIRVTSGNAGNANTNAVIRVRR